MSTRRVSDKVISLNERRPLTPLRREEARGQERKVTKVVAVTSGKGGVGKTNIVANIGFELSRAGQRVMILDADLGLGNLDILLGLTPKYNLSHVIMGDKRIDEVVLEGPGGLRILPAASGIQELTQLSRDQKIGIFTELERMLHSVDFLLIDSGAGISPNVLDFSVTAQQILVVVTPEPTSITDAYALMKVLSMKYAEKACRLIVNQVTSEQEGREIYRQLNLVAEKFLAIKLDYFGCILKDETITTCVKQQRIVNQSHPDSMAARCLRNLARKTGALPRQKALAGERNLIWSHIFQQGAY
jgi:flagellar biosynthesis protein FlhG